jgi:hypothetical protein
MKPSRLCTKSPKLPPGFGLRWQAKRDTALGEGVPIFQHTLPHPKAPSPLRSAGAVQKDNCRVDVNSLTDLILKALRWN